MGVKVSNYRVCGEDKVNTDTLEFNCENGKGWLEDQDVARMWVQDECLAQYGVEIEDGFDMEIV